MRVCIVKPVGDHMIPFPSVTLPKAPFFKCIPPEGVRVEWPGPDGYWVRLRNAGAVEVIDEPVAGTAAAPKAKKKED